jgi:hypothetical protein
MAATAPFKHARGAYAAAAKGRPHCLVTIRFSHYNGASSHHALFIIPGFRANT